MSHPGRWAPPPSGRDLSIIIAVDCVLWLVSVSAVVWAVRRLGMEPLITSVVSVPLCLAAAFAGHLVARKVSRTLAWRRLRRRLDDELG